MPLVPPPKNCDESVKRAIQLLSKKLGYTASPTFVNLILKGLTTGLLHSDSEGTVSSGSLYVAAYGALLVGD